MYIHRCVRIDVFLSRHNPLHKSHNFVSFFFFFSTPLYPPRFYTLGSNNELFGGFSRLSFRHNHFKRAHVQYSNIILSLARSLAHTSGYAREFPEERYPYNNIPCVYYLLYTYIRIRGRCGPQGFSHGELLQRQGQGYGSYDDGVAQGSAVGGGRSAVAIIETSVCCSDWPANQLHPFGQRFTSTHTHTHTLILPRGVQKRDRLAMMRVRVCVCVGARARAKKERFYGGRARKGGRSVGRDRGGWFVKTRGRAKGRRHEVGAGGQLAKCGAEEQTLVQPAIYIYT